MTVEPIAVATLGERTNFEHGHTNLIHCLVRSGMKMLDNVKVYKANGLYSYIVVFANPTTQRRCRNLISRCSLLINELREGDGVVSADRQAALNEAEGSVSPIRVVLHEFQPRLGFKEF